jgi:hypothetical protein
VTHPLVAIAVVAAVVVIFAAALGLFTLFGKKPK